MEIGQRLPEVLGKDQDGKEIKLSDFKGRKLVLYVYPKDSTPGCTNEACNLRDNYERFLSLGYAVVGVSIQSAESHKKFIAKYDLPFPLIADTDKTLVTASVSMVRRRCTARLPSELSAPRFVADEDGVITEIFKPRQIKVKEHAAQILGDK